MQSQKIYPLRNDLVFKMVFGKEGNEPLLACLIEAVLALEGNRRIEELTLLSPLNLQNWTDDKFTIVDVKAVDRARRRFTIEMQVGRRPYFTSRMAYYLALLFAAQLQEGKGYGSLHPAFGIAILDYILFPGHDRLQSDYAFRERSTGESLPDLMELNFVELPKFRERPRGLQSRLERWLTVLKFGERFVADDSFPEEFYADKELSMAIEELRRINADEQRRAILEQREKEDRDRITELNAAREEGIEKGIEQGIDKGIEKGLERGRLEQAFIIARNMLAMKLDREIVSRATGLSLAQIEQLQSGEGLSADS